MRTRVVRRTERCAACAATFLVAMGCTTNDAAARLGLPARTALPGWAAELAGPLPETTARLLRLDRTQRERNPLGARLSALLRREAANELRCEPVVAAATADLARVAAESSPNDEIALAFARQLTRAGHAITDAEFASVLAAFGAERTTAIVHTVAYANFLCRIVHGLGGTDAVPIVAALPEAQAAVDPAKVPPRRAPDATTVAASEAPATWRRVTDEQLDAAQQRQQHRTPRIPPPDDTRLTGLTGRAQQMAAKVAWSRVGYGYQPELTTQWFQCLYAFYEESRIDPVFENTMFWVVTRTNDCFY